jgi:hypothetical protein
LYESHKLFIGFLVNKEGLVFVQNIFLTAEHAELYAEDRKVFSKTSFTAGADL